MLALMFYQDVVPNGWAALIALFSILGPILATAVSYWMKSYADKKAAAEVKDALAAQQTTLVEVHKMTNGNLDYERKKNERLTAQLQAAGIVPNTAPPAEPSQPR